MDKLKELLDIASAKEDKIGELIDKLLKAMDSFENQLSCYSCMQLLHDPCILTPCSHIICASCAKSESKCPQCNKAIKERLTTKETGQSTLKDLVQKYEYTKGLITNF